MIDVLQAEALKLLRHRGTWGLVWIVPLGLVALWLVANVLHAAHMVPPRHAKVPRDAAHWIDGTALTWWFASNSFGRYLVAGFAALAFAGEYGWNTWKLIVPHRTRGALIAGKYAVVFAGELVAFVLAGITGILLALIEPLVGGEAIPPGVTAAALLSAHAIGLATASPSLVLTIAYAAAGAILFRSTMAAVITGIVAVTLERLAGAFAMTIPRWAVLALPTDYLDALQGWIATGRATPMMLGQGVVTLGWQTAAIVLAAWTAALIALAVYLFDRQDLT